MDRSSEISEFLRTRRARITPDQAGLAPAAGPRHVPGLRREEVHSDTFRRLWADHDVRAHTTGIPVPTPNMRGTSVPPLQPDSDESPPVS
ncbi:hypothetical protein ACFYYS_27150 [Streptomyces sp. NPDC002120]|uniref:hypothetical protein n=1 Tax=Streptomyces sp. NPDC002120 TaxID=3364631 RepID=UPI003699EF4C